MSFGGDYGKDTGSNVSAVKDAIAAMVAAIPEITIKDETNEFDDKEFKEKKTLSTQLCKLKIKNKNMKCNRRYRYTR